MTGPLSYTSPPLASCPTITRLFPYSGLRSFLTSSIRRGSITHTLPQNEEFAQVEQLLHGQFVHADTRGLTVLPCRKVTSATLVKTRRGPTVLKSTAPAASSSLDLSSLISPLLSCLHCTVVAKPLSRKHRCVVVTLFENEPQDTFRHSSIRILSSTNRKCRDSGIHGQFDRFILLWDMTIGVGGVCSLTSEDLASLIKGVPPPAYFYWRAWFRAGLPFSRGGLTLTCSALILPHGSR
ncbi:hypothetical protein J6590_089957 [Homalodisca vitripennis]|nr:hypothetical protein J6590_089957 [Homalodisca vitripennis]